MNRQELFEIESHRRRINELEQEVQKAKDKSYYSSTDQARMTIGQFTLPLAEELETYLAKHSDGRATTTASAIGCPEIVGWTQIVDPNIIAVIVLKTVFDLHGIYQKLTPSKAANQIGSRLEDEARFRFYEITAPEEVVKAAWDRVTSAGSSPRYRRYSTKVLTEKMLDDLQVDEDLKWKPWSDHYRNTLGLALLEFCYSQGLLVKTTQYVGKNRKQTFIDLSPECKLMQDALFERLKASSYKAYPLIEPPIEWKVEAGEARDNTSGGYYSDFIREQLPLCRGRYYKSEFGTKSVDFLNLLGKVKWQITKPIVDVAEQCRDKGLTVGSLQSVFRDPRLDMPMPLELQELETGHPQRRDWRREMKGIHEHHEEQRRKSIRSRQALTMAMEFSTYDHFHLSWSNDYRGRVYSQQPWLNMQTTEMEKSIIQFADGYELTEKGELWAAQSVGAAFLGSTQAFSERTQWTFDNKELIRAIVDNPIGTLHHWQDCKEPWQFLQLAMEWNEVVLDKNKPLWNVPIGADATASGLQLLSSILRDPIGMKHANVLPPENLYDPPQDCYLHILSLARSRSLQTPETEHLAEHMVHRNIGKVTMVDLYGATHGTIRDRVIKVFAKRGEFGKGRKVTWEDCDKIAYLVEGAARETFPKAYEALAWMKKLGSIAQKNGSVNFKWFTPSGDLVSLQQYKSLSMNLVTSHLGKVTIPTGKSKDLDFNKMKAALSPGYIHSLDASLLKLAFSQWDKPLAVIHDCIKVHPSHMDDAHQKIRHAFIEVCSGDPLSRLAKDMGVTEEQLPLIKQDTGNLDLVLESPYLFN